MVGQYLLQTNEKCYSMLQCPMWFFLPTFPGSKHTLDEVVAEGAHHTVNGAEVEDSTDELAVHAAQQPDRGRGRTRWLFIAAAPVVSFVSLALVLCFANPATSGRKQLWRRSQSAAMSHTDTKKSWWSMF